MISFRYHVVSIVAVFLALAAGVALGAGPLRQDESRSDSRDAAAAAAEAELAVKSEALTATAGFQDSFASTVAPALVNRRLAGRSVTIVVLPSATQASVDAVTQLAGAAGASSIGTVRVDARYLDVSNKQLIEELGSQLGESAKSVQLPPDASGYERLGLLLGHAVGTVQDAGDPVDRDSSSILAGLAASGLVSVDGELARRGSLVLVVTGAPEGELDQQQGAASIAVTMVNALDQSSDGAVLAGPVAAAQEGGPVAAVRADVLVAREVSTVDTLNTTAGAVVTVLALAEQAGGAAGHYGAVDAPDGTMPGAAAAE